VVASDKTGTLTRNEMTVHALWTPEREVDLARAGGAGATNPEAIVELLRAGVLCNDAPSNVGAGASLGDPTETALLAAAELCGVDPVRERAAKPRVAAIPFDAERRLMATLNRVPEGRTALYVKGAPEVVLELCPRAERVAVEQAVDRIAAAGQRVLMFAVRRDPPAGELEEALEELELLRLQAMIDPPRAEAIDAVAACRRAGVRVLMITGDHGAAARAIGTASGPPSA
jgi:magnesium-transporting ATPase (P-type)